MLTNQRTPSDPSEEALGQARADSIVESHEEFLEALVRLRSQHDKTIEQVAEFIGWDPDRVREFEDDDADPTLSSLCLYALAVGARYRLQLADDCQGQAAGIWENLSVFTGLARSTGIASGEFGDCTAGSWDWTPLQPSTRLGVPVQESAQGASVEDLQHA